VCLTKNSISKTLCKQRALRKERAHYSKSIQVLTLEATNPKCLAVDLPGIFTFGLWLLRRMWPPWAIQPTSPPAVRGAIASFSTNESVRLSPTWLANCWCFVNRTSKFIRSPRCSRKTMVASKRHEDLYWFRLEPYVQSQR
jgi:hypothetical protein